PGVFTIPLTRHEFRRPGSTAAVTMPMRSSSRVAAVATSSPWMLAPRFPRAGLHVALLSALLVTFPSVSQSAGDGTLQLHFMDVGQGDGAILIAPDGETILFDDGARGACER